MHAVNGELHWPVDKQEINRGPSGLNPIGHAISTFDPYSTVPLIVIISAFSYSAGNSLHSIGSHLGGGPFHLSSISQDNIARPIISNPSLHLYITVLRYPTDALTKSYDPCTIDAGRPHSISI